MQDRVFLVDGHALVYRAFYAMISRPLRTSHGENTSAPWGIVQFIQKVMTEHRPEYIAFIFDAGGDETFRHEIFDDYKATREKLDETLQQDFDTAMRRVRQILAAFEIPVIERQGFEADDVIGTLARQVTGRGLKAVIVSGDKDFYQLIDGGVVLLNPGRGGPAAIEEEFVDESNAAERLGVPPNRVVDYLALVGDTSDNIPGVRGVGPKTAVDLIQRFGSLEDILEHIDEIKGKRPREALKRYAEEARLSKRLVTIKTDVPIEFDLGELRAGEPNSERLRDLFLELEFHSLVREFAPDSRAAAPAVRELEVEVVTDVERLASIVERAREAGRIALDVRTEEGGSPFLTPIGLAICLEAGSAVYLPLAHELPPSAGELDAVDERAAPENLPPLTSDALRPLRQLLESDDIILVGHDLKRASLALRAAGIVPGRQLRDVMIASYCLDPGRRQHDLEALVLEGFGHKIAGLADVVGRAKAAITFSGLPPRRAARFAGERAELTLRLDERLTRQLDDYDLKKLYDEIEIPLMPVLADMELAGVAIDQAFFGEMSQRLEGELALVKEEIYKLAGSELNINSPIQLREVLFEKLGLPVKKRTKTGPSTDAEVLEQLASEGHQLPRLIIEFRELAKLKSTYVDALPALIDPTTGRIHTSFNQTVTSTGRLSSSDPNLQNIPIRTSLGAEIRKGFIPAEGNLLLAADYSQIELRILAHLSGSEAFLEAFRNGRDVHRETAALIFGVKARDVSAGMRAQAKTVNFATIYGQGPVALARQLGISVSDARRFIQSYFARLPAIREYLDRQVEIAKEQGYVETLFGRRRYIPELQSKNPNIRAFGERVATNSPIQGTAADLIKLAMISIYGELRRRGSSALMILQVHDELLFDVPCAELESIERLVRERMEGALELSVPIGVDMGSGRNWFETKAADG
jgi:DNA polymerase-1